MRLDAMPLVVTLAVEAIGRLHVAAQGCFACCESLVRMSRDTASMAESSYTPPRPAAWEKVVSRHSPLDFLQTATRNNR